MSQTDPLAAAIDLLLSFHRSGPAEASIVTEDALAPLIRSQREASFHDPALPRAVLVGEFKSGKSTLLNALLGGEHAASDLFEMTSWVARYWPSSEPFCYVVDAEGGIRETTPDAFRDRCQRRDFSADELAKIDRVDVGVPDTPVAVAFVDAPGIGSVTRANEQRLVRAIEEADVVIWVTAVDALGGVREGALVETLRESGVPLLVALTKCDYVNSEPELNEVVDFLGDTHGVDSAVVFPVRALDALAAIDKGTDPSSQTGVPALRDYLRQRVAARGTAIRREAAQAHRRHINSIAIDLLARLCADLEDARDRVEEFDAFVDRVVAAVQADAERIVDDVVRRDAFAGRRPEIERDLAGQPGGRAVRAEDITATLSRHIGADHLDNLWHSVFTRLGSETEALWTSHLADGLGEVERIANRFDSSAWRGLGEGLSGELMAAATGPSSDGLESGVTTSVGFAGVATAYAAWLGPAAAQVTLGAAVTGVGIPIALMGAGVAALFHLYRKKGGGGEVSPSILLDAYTDRLIEHVVRPEVYPRVLAMNQAVGARVRSKFRNEVTASLPHGDLEALLRSINQLVHDLKQEPSQLGSHGAS